MNREGNYKYIAHKAKNHPHEYLKERQSELNKIYYKHKWSKGKTLYFDYQAEVLFHDEEEPVDAVTLALNDMVSLMFFVKQGKIKLSQSEQHRNHKIEKILKRLEVFCDSYNYKWIEQQITLLTKEWNALPNQNYDDQTMFKILKLLYGVWVLDQGRNQDNVFDKFKKLIQNQDDESLKKLDGIFSAAPLLSSMLGNSSKKASYAFLNDMFQLMTAIIEVNHPWCGFSIAEDIYDNLKDTIDLDQFLSYVKACVTENSIDPKSYQMLVNEKNNQFKQIAFGRKAKKNFGKEQ